MRKLATSILLFIGVAFCWAEGELSGRFVINANGDVVCFAKGNLVYTQSTKTWSFAEHQYDVIGADNVSVDALAEKIDLFGWSGDDDRASNYGISTSPNGMNYLGNFVDWGQNKITNGGNKLNSGWRTLTAEEWSYLIANNSPFPTTVNGVKGIAIMPHDLHLDVKPASYTIEEWEVDEKKGVVFLPYTGYRVQAAVSAVDTYGYYWTATSNGTEAAKVVRCYNNKITVRSNGGELDRTHGHAVRLVKAASSCVVTIKAESSNPLAGKVTITIDNE